MRTPFAGGGGADEADDPDRPRIEAGEPPDEPVDDTRARAARRAAREPASPDDGRISRLGEDIQRGAEAAGEAIVQAGRGVAATERAVRKEGRRLDESFAEFRRQNREALVDLTAGEAPSAIETAEELAEAERELREINEERDVVGGPVFAGVPVGPAAVGGASLARGLSRPLSAGAGGPVAGRAAQLVTRTPNVEALAAGAAAAGVSVARDRSELPVQRPTQDVTEIQPGEFRPGPEISVGPGLRDVTEIEPGPILPDAELPAPESRPENLLPDVELPTLRLGGALPERPARPGRPGRTRPVSPPEPVRPTEPELRDEMLPDVGERREQATEFDLGDFGVRRREREATTQDTMLEDMAGARERVETAQEPMLDAGARSGLSLDVAAATRPAVMPDTTRQLDTAARPDLQEQATPTELSFGQPRATATDFAAPTAPATATPTAFEVGEPVDIFDAPTRATPVEPGPQPRPPRGPLGRPLSFETRRRRRDEDELFPTLDTTPLLEPITGPAGLLFGRGGD